MAIIKPLGSKTGLRPGTAFAGSKGGGANATSKLRPMTAIS